MRNVLDLRSISLLTVPLLLLGLAACNDGPPTDTLADGESKGEGAPTGIAPRSGALTPSFSIVAAVGDEIASVALPVAGSDVGIAFDGTRIYYNEGSNRLISFEPGDPIGTQAMVTVMDGATAIDLDAMAYDATRDILWAIQHGTQKIYQVDKTTGAATFQFDATGKCTRCAGSYKDGLAFDAGDPSDPSDDALWFSYDVDYEVFKLDLSGGVIESFDVTGIHADLASHGNSGIAVGGDNLYLGTNGAGSVVRVDKATKAFVDVFVSPGFRPEDLECDPVTYAPTEVMWVRFFEDPSAVKAYEIEPATCGLGGGGEPPPPSVETGHMTGGGSVFDDDGNRFTHGFTLQCNVEDGPNNLQINWPKSSGKGRNRFHLESLTSARCSDDPELEEAPPSAGFDTYAGSGEGRMNGMSGALIEFTFTDDGEPGKGADMATITITPPGGGDPIEVSGMLDKGNHQAHEN